tara:strand:- start:107 stop:403 length:297 start_codon:yes stop_codon:yes gene_type:complete
MEFKEKISEGTAQLENYKEIVEQINKTLEKKCNDFLSKNNFKRPDGANSDNADQTQKQIDQYWKKQSQKAEYIYAFGKKVPVDYIKKYLKDKRDVESE